MNAFELHIQLRELQAERALIELDFAWPGNVRHLEQLAARLSMRGGAGAVGPAELLGLLDPRREAAPAGPGARDLSSGLPSLLEDAERGWLEQALRSYPDLTRAELAGRLKISESALYKKLRQYGLAKA